MSSKNLSITYCKGFAIILMVICHAGMTGYGRDVTYMFHMPLFFFFSGYCLKDGYLDDLFGFVKKRFVSLYIPYVKWSAVFLISHFLLLQIPQYRALLRYEDNICSLPDLLKNLLFVFATMSKCPPILGGFWFLKSLLIASIGTLFLLKVIKNRFIILLIYLLILFITKSCSPNNVIDIVNLALVGGCFYVSGAIFKHNSISFQKGIMLLLAIILFVAAYFFPSEMGTIEARDILPYYVAGICGSFLTFYLSTKLEHSSFELLKHILHFAGENTMFILIWHMLSFKIISALIVCYYGLDWCRLTDTPVINEYATQSWWIVYSITSLVVIFGVAKLKNHLC